MKKIFVCMLLVFASSFAFSQGADLKSIEKYVVELRKLKFNCTEAYNEFANVLYNDKNLASGEEKLKQLQETVNSSLTKLKSIKAYKGETELKASLVGFMKTMRSVASNELVEIISIYRLKQPTSRDSERLNKVFQQYSSKLGNAEKRFDNAGQSFLAKYYVVADAGRFCKDMRKLLESAQTGFTDIKGKKNADESFFDNYAVTFQPDKALTGRVEDWYFPQAIYTYYEGKDQAMAEKYFKDMDKLVNDCRTGFKRTEALLPLSSLSSTNGSRYKYIEKEEGESGRGIIIEITKNYSGYRVKLIVNNYGAKK